MNIRSFFITILLLSMLTAGLSDSGAASLADNGPQPYMVKNINERNGSSSPNCRVALEEVMLCIVNDGIHGQELWRSNGTADGTSLIKDIFPGEKSSESAEFIVSKDGRFAYFTAQDNVHGRELWKTDGTPEGTVIVKEINAGPKSSYVSYLTMVGEELFFLFYNYDCPSFCYELWKTDGTASGTVLVKDLTPEVAGSDNYLSPCCFVAMDNTLYFAYDDGVHGRELWRSDGSEAGTYMVKDISPVYTWQHNVSDLIVNGDLLFFTVDDNVHGRELWGSDGTEAGTVLVKDIAEGTETSNPNDLIVMNGALYFEAQKGEEFGLWRSDGTKEGTTLVKVLEGTWFPLHDPVATDSLLFFLISLEGYHKTWRSDGTTEGTFVIENFPGDLGEGDMYSVCNEALFPAKDKVFACRGDEKGYELWASDGSEAGTYLVKDIVPGPESSGPRVTVLFKNQVYFQANRRPEGTELWKTNGTEAGTLLVGDLNTTDERGSYPGNFGPVVNDKGQVIFIADDTFAGKEPMLTDGTAKGTEVFVDINPGYAQSSGEYSPTPVQISNGQIFFIANTDELGREMWTSDGTPEGTSNLLDICPGQMDTTIKHLVATKNKAFFVSPVPSGQGCSSTDRLWRSSGTSVSTATVIDEFDIEVLKANEEFIFYRTSDYDLKVMNETAETPQILADYTFGFELAGNKLFYYRHVPEMDAYLWVSDGTPVGSQQLKKTKWIDGLIPAGDLLYFLENDGTGTRALWVSDGTKEGTRQVLGEIPNQAGPTEFETAGDNVYFVLIDEDGSGDLWLTDGTPSATRKVKDFSPDENGPYSLTALKEVLFFTLEDGAHGLELWSSAGTAESTRMVADINPEPGVGSGPYNLAARGNLLYFSANDGLHGTELWAFNLETPPPPTADFSASPTSGAPPLVVNFSNLSSGEYDSCAWSFGDGANSNDCKDPSHTYSIPGNFQVSLTVSGPGGENTKTKKDFIHVIHVIEDDHWIFMPNVWGD